MTDLNFDTQFGGQQAPPPPPPHPGWQQPPPGWQPYYQPPKRRRRWPWVLGAMVGFFVLIGIISAAAGAKNSTTSKPFTGTASHPASADVSITGCSIDSIDVPHADIAIVNHSSGTSDYTYSVNFLQGSTVVSQGSSLEDNISAGQHATDDVLGTTIDNPSAAPLSCQLTSVTRMASS